MFLKLKDRIYDLACALKRNIWNENNTYYLKLILEQVVYFYQPMSTFW